MSQQVDEVLQVGDCESALCLGAGNRPSDASACQRHLAPTCGATLSLTSPPSLPPALSAATVDVQLRRVENLRQPGGYLGQRSVSAPACRSILWVSRESHWVPLMGGCHTARYLSAQQHQMGPHWKENPSLNGATPRQRLQRFCRARVWILEYRGRHRLHARGLGTLASRQPLGRLSDRRVPSSLWALALPFAVNVVLTGRVAARGAEPPVLQSVGVLWCLSEARQSDDARRSIVASQSQRHCQGPHCVGLCSPVNEPTIQHCRVNYFRHIGFQIEFSAFKGLSYSPTCRPECCATLQAARDDSTTVPLEHVALQVLSTLSHTTIIPRQIKSFRAATHTIS